MRFTEEEFGWIKYILAVRSYIEKALEEGEEDEEKMKVILSLVSYLYEFVENHSYVIINKSRKMNKYLTLLDKARDMYNYCTLCEMYN